MKTYLHDEGYYLLRQREMIENKCFRQKRILWAMGWRSASQGKQNNNFLREFFYGFLRTATAHLVPCPPDTIRAQISLRFFAGPGSTFVLK